MNEKIEIETNDLFVLLKYVNERYIDLDFESMTATYASPSKFIQRWKLKIPKDDVEKAEKEYKMSTDILLKAGWAIVEEMGK